MNMIFFPLDDGFIAPTEVAYLYPNNAYTRVVLSSNLELISKLPTAEVAEGLQEFGQPLIHLPGDAGFFPEFWINPCHVVAIQPRRTWDAQTKQDVMHATVCMSTGVGLAIALEVSELATRLETAL